MTVLWGDRGRLCIPAGADDIQALLPGTQVEILGGIGHTPQIECPEVVADAIEQSPRRAHKQAGSPTPVLGSV